MSVANCMRSIISVISVSELGLVDFGLVSSLSWENRLILSGAECVTLDVVDTFCDCPL